MPPILPTPLQETLPPVEEEQPPAPVIESEVPLEAGEGAVLDAMSNAVPDPNHEEPLTVVPEAPPVIETVPNPLEESETLRDQAEKESARAKLREDQKELEKQFAREAFPHVRTGSANDGETYHNDAGNTVRLDKRGHQYSCDVEGVRNTRKSSRPVDIDPEQWTLVRNYRERAKKKEQLKAQEMLPQGSDPPNKGCIIIIRRTHPCIGYLIPSTFSRMCL